MFVADTECTLRSLSKKLFCPVMRNIVSCQPPAVGTLMVNLSFWVEVTFFFQLLNEIVVQGFRHVSDMKLFLQSWLQSLLSRLANDWSVLASWTNGFLLFQPLSLPSSGVTLQEMFRKFDLTSVSACWKIQLVELLWRVIW